MSSDAKRDDSPRSLTRRKVLGGIGLALMAAPLGHLLACGPDGTTDGNTGDGTDTDGGTGTDAGTDPGFWATGGTAAMTAASVYPNPFASGGGAACTLTCEATLGPCYAETIERKDISENHDGLPVRLAFLVVDESCNPIPGATVDELARAITEGNSQKSKGTRGPRCSLGPGRAGEWTSTKAHGPEPQGIRTRTCLGSSRPKREDRLATSRPSRMASTSDASRRGAAGLRAESCGQQIELHARQLHRRVLHTDLARLQVHLQRADLQKVLPLHHRPSQPGAHALHQLLGPEGLGQSDPG